jgi:hypothetical protein
MNKKKSSNDLKHVEAMDLLTGRYAVKPTSLKRPEDMNEPGSRTSL